MRVTIAKDALEHMLLTQVRAHAGCEDILVIEIERLTDPHSDVNWQIRSIGYGVGGRAAADRAAHVVQNKLRHQFVLE